MPSTFDFTNNYITPPEQNMMMQQQYAQQYNPQQQIKRMPEPEVVVEPGGLNFTTIDDINDKSNMTITVDTGPTPDVGLPTKKRGRPRKNEIQTVNSAEIVKAEGTVEESTISTYSETAFLLKNTIDQVDMVASEVKHELDSVRNNRTFKNRYNVMVGLTSNLSDLLNAKIGAIKEMNNCISKANDMDYKIRKDRKEAEAGLGDDKMIMDLYQTFVQNPTNFNHNTPQMPPANQGGLDIVRAPEAGAVAGQADQGYLNYMANLTPEQNMMLLEQNPDVKQCVVFDAATGNRWFQVMNIKTGQPIPNAPTLDPMFMEDVTLDTKNKIAKNINLGQTYPLIIINDGVAKEY